jgi:hypothetical protein
LFVSAFFLVAEEFHVESDFRMGHAAPVRSTTLFDGNIFYDFIGTNGEMMLLDLGKDTFTLVDPALRIQTQIDAEDTRKKTEQLRQRILSDPKAKTDSFHYFACKPKFTSEFDAAGTWALQSNWIDYEIKTVPFTDPSAAMYYDFCDWVCYLNLRINPYSSQMLTRLEVNRLLRTEKKFAVSVSESIYVNGKQGLAKPAQTSSSHNFIRRLGDADHKRIEQAQEFKRTFPQVSFEEYQKRFAEKSGNY